MLNLIKSAHSAEHCQRNWDETLVVKEQDINDLVEICTTMPTKQNIPTYDLIVSKDIEYNKEIFKYCYNTQDSTHLKNIEKNIYPNPQVASQVLFIWLTKYKAWNKNTPFDVFMDDVNLGIGISSGATALAANSYGYKTGFCKCFDGEGLNEFLQNSFDINKDNRVNLLLGIGLPIKDLPHNYSLTQYSQSDHDTFSKQIKVHYKN
jgi:hypothetical protein